MFPNDIPLPHSLTLRPNSSHPLSPSQPFPFRSLARSLMPYIRSLSLSLSPSPNLHPRLYPSEPPYPLCTILFHPSFHPAPCPSLRGRISFMPISHPSFHALTFSPPTHPPPPQRSHGHNSIEWKMRYLLGQSWCLMEGGGGWMDGWMDGWVGMRGT